jgi:hypothetical protein
MWGAAITATTISMAAQGDAHAPRTRIRISVDSCPTDAASVSGNQPAVGFVAGLGSASSNATRTPIRRDGFGIRQRMQVPGSSTTSGTPLLHSLGHHRFDPPTLGRQRFPQPIPKRSALFGAERARPRGHLQRVAASRSETTGKPKSNIPKQSFSTQYGPDYRGGRHSLPSARDRSYEGDWYTTITEQAEQNLPIGGRPSWSELSHFGRSIEIPTRWETVE